jgi:type I restriction enzyme, S subunit
MRHLTLADLCLSIIDCAHKTAPCDDFGDYYAVGTPAMRGNVINYAEARRIDKKTFEEWTSRLRPKFGDLLLAREAPVGPVVRIPPLENVAPGQRTVLLRPDGAVMNSAFLYYYLTSPARQNDLLAKASGSTVPHLNVSDVRALPVPDIPSLAEQRSIVAVLEAIDDKIAANGSAMSMARDLCNAHFSKALAVAPGNSCTLGDLVDREALLLSDGYRTKRSEHGVPGIRILRAGDVRDFRIFSDGTDFVSEEFRSQIGAKTSRNRDIVLTTKGTVGRVAVVSRHMEEVVYSPQMCFFRVLDEGVMDVGFLAAWFSSQGLAEQLSLVMHKSDMAPYVNLQDIRTLRIPLPDIAVQQSEGSFQWAMIEYIHALSRENDILARTRDELLPLLMSGRIKVRDAEKIVGRRSE